MLKRIPEPELMLGEEQARAYAEADFEEAHSRFIDLFREIFPRERVNGHVLDLGCGPADISLRFARAYPRCKIHGVDGSETMLKLGSRHILEQDLVDRVQLFHTYLPATNLPRKKYSVIISNSLLHHLRDPNVLWSTINRFAAADAAVFVMDLMRPTSKTKAKVLVKTHARGEPPILKRDFYNSLLAAYRPPEILVQLHENALSHLQIDVVSDRHWIVYGRKQEG